MLTQIFIPSAAGCQPEFTKIASQSFGFQPTGLPTEELKPVIFTGGNVHITDLYQFPVWSAEVRDYGMPYQAGNITGTIDAPLAAMGIPLPINLVADDVVTISGNVSYNYATDYIEAGYDVNLIVGVYYFNCNDITDQAARVFTFIPVSTAAFDKSNKVCFEASVKLGSNFDIYETRILVGYDIIVTCPDICVPPTIDVNAATVSYTLDIERPCKAEVTNYIIKNCCEGSITELVNIPGLVVGNFHVDNEGNCWEVMEVSDNVTNFTRTFTDIYTTCLECQDANPCPLNLSISSCCVEGTEFVTGSLPGLNVGDTFVDNYGLCWTVEAETGAPISEESITVVSIIKGGCETCTTENPCPNFYEVLSCCANIGGIIAVPDLLSIGDAFVDTNGICWQVTGGARSLPTIYGIEVVTVYPYPGPGSEVTACDLCIAANPCPTEYFITIKSCCDPDRVEVAQVPAGFMIFTEGTIFQDDWGICWEVISFNTTGVETYPIFDWFGGTKPLINTYQDCRECRGNSLPIPCGFYEVRECGSETTTIVMLTNPLAIGLVYSLGLAPTTCYEIIGYGYPVIGELYPIFDVNPGLFTTCEECLV